MDMGVAYVFARAQDAATLEKGIEVLPNILRKIEVERAWLLEEEVVVNEKEAFEKERREFSQEKAECDKAHADLAAQLKTYRDDMSTLREGLATKEAERQKVEEGECASCMYSLYGSVWQIKE
jgi:uncharacterized protein (DUF3084 family)